MKTSFALASILLWQMAVAPSPAPQYMQFERALNVPQGTAGQTCAALDASVFAHAATESLNDVRLYARSTDGHTTEIPFNLTESEAAIEDDEQASLQNLGVHNGDIVFDLAMPRRPYSAVVLDLAAKDFLATVRVSGSDGHGGKAKDLGSFALFDLSAQHLSRSTTLPLQESTFPVLHVTLHVTPAPDTSLRVFSPDLVRGANVPPSREAQTLYTVVAQTSTLITRGHKSLATIHIPAHVPVERIAFTPAPGFTQNFLRTVNITATPDTTEDHSEAETVSGNISRVRLPQDSTPETSPVDSHQLSIDDALGANLRGDATVVVTIENGDDPALPLADVQLEMRQRKICFDVTPTVTAYTLMYGDPALHAPVYDYARLFISASRPSVATLGSEQHNPAFTPRVDTRPYSERHPELLWVGLLAVIAVLGSVALGSARRQSR